MEKEKNVCCEESKNNCCGNHGMAKCCTNWQKCHLIKMILLAIVILVAFCLGSQWGEMKSESRNYRFEKGSRMMNWNDERFNGKVEDKNIVTDEITVEVEGAPTKK